MDPNTIEQWEDEIPESDGSEPVCPEVNEAPSGFFLWLYLLSTRTVITLQQSLKGDEYRYLFLSIFIGGMGEAVTGLVNTDIAESLGISIFYMIFGGLVYGGLRYVILGSVFHALICICGGRGKWRDSQAILMYAKLPGNLIYVVIGGIYLLMNQVVQNVVAFQVISMSLLLAMLLIIVLQIKIQFAGAIHVQKANVTASLILFVIMPFLYNVFHLVRTFVGLMN